MIQIHFGHNNQPQQQRRRLHAFLAKSFKYEQTMLILRNMDSWYHESPFGGRYKLTAPNINSFKFLDDLYKEFPLLKQILIEAENLSNECGGGRILAAGGAIMMAIWGVFPNQHPNPNNQHNVYGWTWANCLNKMDVDLFFYGFDNDIDANGFNANNAGSVRNANKMLDSLCKSLLKHPNTTISKSQNTTTICQDGRKYQFIHRLYPKKGHAGISQILGGFDLGPCMIGTDGDEIYTTPLGCFSIGTKTLIVDPKRQSPSFASRLQKYGGRGFTPILPGTNIEKILHCDPKTLFHKYSSWGSRTSTLDFGSIKLSINKISRHRANQIGLQGKPLIVNFCKWGGVNNTNIQSDYGGGMNFSFRRACMLANKDKPEYINIVAKDFETLNNFKFDFGPSFRQYMLKIFPKDLKLLKNYTRKRFNRWFGEDDELVMACIINSDKDTYRKIVKKHITKIITNLKIASSNLSGPRHWITKNPGRQWTSSFHPDPISDPTFYHKYYDPYFIGIPHEIETCLRLLRRRKHCPMSRLNKDAFNYLLLFVCKTFADIGYEKCIGQRLTIKDT